MKTDTHTHTQHTISHFVSMAYQKMICFCLLCVHSKTMVITMRENHNMGCTQALSVCKPAAAAAIVIAGAGCCCCCCFKHANIIIIINSIWSRVCACFSLVRAIRFVLQISAFVNINCFPQSRYLAQSLILTSFLQYITLHFLFFAFFALL